MRLSFTRHCQNQFGFLHLHSVFPPFLCFNSEWQQSLRQFKIHFWKTAKRRMSICGTRRALQSCPRTAKDMVTQVILCPVFPHDPQASPSAAVSPKAMVSLSRTGFPTHTEQQSMCVVNITPWNSHAIAEKKG